MGPRRSGEVYVYTDARYADPPIPFCEVEAPGAASPVARAALPTCLICCLERPRFAAVGRCGHAEVCWLCAVRLRALLRDFHCPICKEELPEVALVSDVAAGIGGLAGSRLVHPALRDDELGIVYGSTEVRAEVERIFDYSCWLRGCDRSFTTIAGLERHLRDEHGRQFCATCLRDRKVFLFEQTLYSPEDFERHHREGDSPQHLDGELPPTPPHAQCNFCRRSFYSQDELLSHMHKRHHLCGLCERQGRRNEFYRDYAYLSLHYEENHYICAHENCRRGTYRLVAFASEDELRMHEVAEHAIGEKTAQRSRKQGVRLNLQMGTMSYREERRRQGAGQAGAGAAAQAEERARAEASGGEVRVRFMWTRRQPPQPSQSPDGWGEPLDGNGGGGGGGRWDEEEEGRRYPPRPFCRPHPRRGAGGVAAAAATGEAAPQPEAAAAPPLGAAGSSSGSRSSWRRRAGAASTASCDDAAGGPISGGAGASASAGAAAAGLAARSQLLGAALWKVQMMGIDSAAELDAEEYRECNRRFRLDLEAAFGAERLAEFKTISAGFRQETAQGAGAQDVANAVRGYADRVLEVFEAAMAAVGEARAANLLGDLIVLLPDEALRHSLFHQLREMKQRVGEIAEAARTAARGAAQSAAEAATPRRGPFMRRHDAAAAAAAARASAVAAPTATPAGPGAPAAAAEAAERPAPLPAALEAVPASEAFWEASDRQPSFILALDVVLAALAQDDARLRQSAVASERTLTMLIRALDGHQAESLESMQQHLSCAGAGHLDFSTMERLLALRPQLLLKLQATRQGAGALARAWGEWKEAAAAAVRSLGLDERCCVKSYVRLCLRHRAGTLPDSVEEGPVEEAFPALQSVCGKAGGQRQRAEDLLASTNGCLGLDNDPQESRARRKGGKQQRQVLAAWG